MPQEISPEHLAIEQDIAAISADLKARKAAEGGISKEDLKSAIGARIEAAPASAAATAGKPSQPTSSSLPAYAQNAPEGIRLKIEKLIDIAWHKGIWRAVQEARSSDPLTLDALHDALTDKIYDEFKKRGLL